MEDFMFWIGRKQPQDSAQAEADVAELVRPVPTPQQPVVMPDAYRAQAEKIGFSPDEIFDLEVHTFLVEQQIPIYDLRQVYKFLAALADSHSAIHYWRPLRRKDEINFSGWSWGNTTQHDCYNGELAACRVYERLVPLHALHCVEIIEQQFDGKVSFFVSDYATPPEVDPDPFLLIAAPKRIFKRRVIAAWDEPGFGVS
jgi:hypothetical protein